MSIIFLSSITLSILYPSFKPKIEIEFHPSSMLSYPDHVAWVVAEVESDEEQVFIEVDTNTSVFMEYNVISVGNSNYVVDIFLYPENSHLNSDIEIHLSARTTHSIKTRSSINVKVIEWFCSLPTDVLDIRDFFIEFIEQNTTLSNVNSSTEWSFCGNAPQILVVEHYLFRSLFWEMEISKHVMIPPYDWVQVYLRPRNQITPIWSAKIDSLTLDNTSIYEIEPPTEIFR